MNMLKGLSISILIFLVSSNISKGQNLSELFRNSVKSVVTIYTTELKFAADGVSPQQALGSGVIISDDGLT